MRSTFLPLLLVLSFAFCGILAGCGPRRGGSDAAVPPADAFGVGCGLEDLDGVVWSEDPASAVVSVCEATFEIRLSRDPAGGPEDLTAAATIEGFGELGPGACVATVERSPEEVSRSDCRWPDLALDCDVGGGRTLHLGLYDAVSAPAGETRTLHSGSRAWDLFEGGEALCGQRYGR